MAKGKRKQAEVQAEDNETPAPRPRSSKFKEATMNSTTSIHAPPDEMWNDLGIDHLLDKFNEENSAPASSSAAVRTRTHKRSGSQPITHISAAVATPTVAPASEGPLGRFSRAVASFFNGAGASFSALGKRKAGNENAEKGTVAGGERAASAEKAGEERKKEVEAAYKEAKELGLLPAPKVFVRPVSRARKAQAATLAALDTPTPVPDLNSLAPPRTPTLYKSPSKKDLHKQKKLSKRVSDLEYKLAEARKELTLALQGNSPNVPPVPVIPSDLPSPPKTDPSPPNTQHFWSENETSPNHDAEMSSKNDPAPASKNDPVAVPKNDPVPASKNEKVGKIVKKRKAGGDDDGVFKPIPTDSDISMDSEPSIKRAKTTSKKLKRKSSGRLTKKKTNVKREEVVTVVPDGVTVPAVPQLPSGVKGKRAAVSDDPYGGLEHEMF